jgi:hypothetical protein
VPNRSITPGSGAQPIPGASVTPAIFAVRSQSAHSRGHGRPPISRPERAGGAGPGGARPRQRSGLNAIGIDLIEFASTERT